MSENQPNDPSRKPSQGSSQNELDALLSQASDFAEELSDDVGGNDDEQPQAQAAEVDLQHDQRQTDGIEDQLSETENLLASAEDQILGEDPAEADSQYRDPNAVPVEDFSADPDSMDFREAAAALRDDDRGPTGENADSDAEDEVGEDSPDESGGEGAGGASATAPDEKPFGGKVVKLGKKKGSGDAPETKAEAPPAATAGVEVEEAGETAETDEAEDGFGDFDFSDLDDDGLPDLGGPGLPSLDDDEFGGLDGGQAKGDAGPGRMVEAVGTTLDTLDRPFGSISPRTKEIIGWVALAMLFGAVSLFLISFFL